MVRFKMTVESHPVEVTRCWVYVPDWLYFCPPHMYESHAVTVSEVDAEWLMVRCNVAMLSQPLLVCKCWMYVPD